MVENTSCTPRCCDRLTGAVRGHPIPVFWVKKTAYYNNNLYVWKGEMERDSQGQTRGQNGGGGGGLIYAGFDLAIVFNSSVPVAHILTRLFD